MNSSIISIGNSKGIRIPKTLLLESGINKKVDIKAKKGQIIITAIVEEQPQTKPITMMSQKSLEKDWNNKEEDLAWQDL